MVESEVAFGQVHRAVGLIVEAIVGLRAVAEIGGVPVVDAPIHAAVVAGLVERARDGFGRLRRKPCLLREDQLGIGLGSHGLGLALAFALDGEKGEEFVLYEGTTHRTSKKLATVIRMLADETAMALGDLLVRVERALAEEAEGRAMVVVGPCLGDHVDSSALRAAVSRGEPLGAY